MSDDPRPGVVVTGSIVGRPDSIDSLIEASLDHVRRSRLEPGCLSHAVHRDVENPLRLVFVERWANRDALRAHFAVPASGEFARVAQNLAASPPTIDIYDIAPR
jgi:quinol monooxygenase YgiN